MIERRSWRIVSIFRFQDGAFGVNGTCTCGYGRNMMVMRDFGPPHEVIPQCNSCSRDRPPGECVLISEEAVKLWEVELIMMT